VDHVRETLEKLIREHKTDYVTLSRLLGRNAAYIQQFMRRGTPRKLDEDDRRTLAEFFQVDDTVLGGPRAPVLAPPGAKGIDYIRVPRLAVSASAGQGAVVEADRTVGEFVIDAKSARELGDPKHLSMIQVMGDSMTPTLDDGDDILVDQSAAATKLRDGIYVLRIDDALNVKRIALNPGGGFSVKSDNPEYPSWENVDPARIVFIGRVVWVGRRVR